MSSARARFTMAKNILRLNNLLSEGRLPLFVRSCAGQAENKSSGGSGTVNPNVPGLSTNCLKVSTDPVGPGAAKNAVYKNPEYFSYNTISYFEAEVEMSKYRIPQPSSKK